MSRHDMFETMFRDFIAGRLSRRDLMQAAGIGAGAAVAMAGVAAAAPLAAGRSYHFNLQDATPAANVKTGGRLKMGMQSDPGGLDPVKLSATALWHVVEHIYSRLTNVNPDLTVYGELAEKIDISDDGLTYTFHLRPGVSFHNGRALVANDVVYSFKRLVDPATASTSAATLASMKDVAAPDDATVVLTLNAPDASILAALSDVSCIIVPKEVVDANGDLSQVAVGSGPFTFKEYVPSTSITLDKNANYWEPGLPYLDGLDMIIASDDTARTAAVTSGTVDFIEYAPLRDIDNLQKDSSLTVAGNSNTNIRFIGFNMRNKPFDDVRVRQAIAKAIDRQAVLGPAVFGHGTPVATIFPPDFWAALKVDLPAPDIDGAKKLLADAGYPDGFKTTITSWSAYSFLSAPAQVIQEQLKQIGIDAELNLEDTPTLIQDVYSAYKYDIAVTGDSAYVDPNTLVINNFETGASGNFVGYSNPKVDDLIKQAVAETDQSKRAEIYQQIQQILIDDVPWVSLFVANQFEVMKNYVKDYVHIPTGSNASLKKTWLDK